MTQVTSNANRLDWDVFVGDFNLTNELNSVLNSGGTAEDSNINITDIVLPGDNGNVTQEYFSNITKVLELDDLTEYYQRCQSDLTDYDSKTNGYFERTFVLGNTYNLITHGLGPQAPVNSSSIRNHGTGPDPTYIAPLIRPDSDVFDQNLIIIQNRKMPIVRVNANFYTPSLNQLSDVTLNMGRTNAIIELFYRARPYLKFQDIYKVDLVAQDANLHRKHHAITFLNLPPVLPLLFHQFLNPIIIANRNVAPSAMIIYQAGGTVSIPINAFLIRGASPYDFFLEATLKDVDDSYSSNGGLFFNALDRRTNESLQTHYTDHLINRYGCQELMRKYLREEYNVTLHPNAIGF